MITVDDVKKSRSMRMILHVVKHLGEVSEKGLTRLLYEMKEKGVDLGYQFVKIGNVVGSKDLHQDIMDLLYVGLMERNPARNKLRLTRDGEEFLEKYGLPEEDVKPVLSLVDQLKPVIEPIEAEVEMRRRA